MRISSELLMGFSFVHISPSYVSMGERVLSTSCESGLDMENPCWTQGAAVLVRIVRSMGGGAGLVAVAAPTFVDYGMHHWPPTALLRVIFRLLTTAASTTYHVVMLILLVTRTSTATGISSNSQGFVF